MFTRQEKILLAVLASIQFCHIVDFMIIMPLGHELMNLFQVGPSEFGLLVSAYTLSAGCSGFFSAFFMDRFDRRSALQFFFIGFMVGTLACAYAPTYYALLLSRAFTGAFGGVLGSIVLAIVGDAIPMSRRGTAIGVVTSAFSVASIAGVPFSLYLANKFGWHMPFVFLVIVSLIIFILAYFQIPSMRSHMNLDRKKESPVELMRSVVSDQSQLTGLFFMFFLVMGHFTIIPFIAPSMIANVGLSKEQLPLIYLVGGGVSIIAGPLVGRICDKYGLRKIFAYSVAFAILPVILLTNLRPMALPLVLGVVAMFFMSNSGRWIPAMSLLSSAVLPQHRGAYMSFVNSVQNISAAVAAYLAGLIVTTNPDGKLLHYPVIGFIAIVCGIFSFFLSRKVKQLS